MRKLYISKKPYFITTRTQSGLPMVCSHNMNAVIEGILAKALEKFPVQLCHYKFLANHFHMVVVPLDPGNLSNFMGYLKAEIAHAINNKLGIRKRTVFDVGFDSPILLDAETTISKIVYLYGNAAKANLVETVDMYPGVSSWEMYKSGNMEKRCFKVAREQVFTLEKPSMGVREQFEVRKELLKGAEELKLELEPDAWMECFEDEVDKEAANKEIVERVYILEKECQEEREKTGKTVMGVTNLRRQSMAREYTPSKFSKRMICLGASKLIRAPFIKKFKELCLIARDVYERWKFGDYSLKIPAGMFAPRKPHTICCLEI